MDYVWIKHLIKNYCVQKIKIDYVFINEINFLRGIKIYIEVRNICEIIANYLKMKIIEKLRRGFQLKLKWKPKKRLIYKMR